MIDCSFIDGHITEEGLKIYEELAKNEIGTIFTGTAVVSDYNASKTILNLEWIKMNT